MDLKESHSPVSFGRLIIDEENDESFNEDTSKESLRTPSVENSPIRPSPTKCSINDQHDTKELGYTSVISSVPDNISVLYQASLDNYTSTISDLKEHLESESTEVVVIDDDLSESEEIPFEDKCDRFLKSNPVRSIFEKLSNINNDSNGIIRDLGNVEVDLDAISTLDVEELPNIDPNLTEPSECDAIHDKENFILERNPQNIDIVSQKSIAEKVVTGIIEDRISKVTRAVDVLQNHLNSMSAELNDLQRLLNSNVLPVKSPASNLHHSSASAKRSKKRKVFISPPLVDCDSLPKKHKKTKNKNTNSSLKIRPASEKSIEFNDFINSLRHSSKKSNSICDTKSRYPEVKECCVLIPPLTQLQLGMLCSPEY